MLTITVPRGQFWDEQNEKFVYSNETTLVLEHSLIAISKWEAKYHKLFLGKTKRSESETRYYIKCMTINKVDDDKVYWALTAENIDAIDKYIHDPMTATKVPDSKSSKKDKHKKETEFTSEYIYYLMILYNIPHEYEKWHIERLLTLIRVCSYENERNDPNKKKEKKISTNEQLDRMAALNEQRKAALHTRG